MAVKTDVKLATLSYVILYVSNTKEATAFYRDTLGMKVKMDEEGWVELDAGAVTLALHHHEGQLPKEREGQPIVVFGVEKIHEAYEALKSKGIKFSDEPHEVCQTPDHVGLSADFKDPWGNAISIFGMEKK